MINTTSTTTTTTINNSKYNKCLKNCTKTVTGQYPFKMY